MNWPGDTLSTYLKACGGKLTATIDKKLTCLILGARKGKSISAEEKQVNDLNQNHGASILVMTADRFHQLAQLTLAEFVELARAGSAGVKILQSIGNISHLLLPPNYDHADLHGLHLDGLTFAGILTGVDLHGASLRNSSVSFDGCNLEDADLQETHVYQLTRCNAARLKARQVHRVERIDETDITSANFEKADLSFFAGANVKAAGSNWLGASAPFSELSHGDFTQARMKESNWQESQFANMIFSQVDFRKAYLGNCKWEACDFRGADLSDANLEGAVFTRCDLTGAKLRGTNLFDATFDDCALSNADFTGARVVGVKVDDAKVAEAVGFDLAATKIGRTLGTHLQQFDAVAAKCTRCQTSAVVHDKAGAHAVSAATGQWTSLGGISGQMLRSARQYAGATLQPDSIRFSCSGLTIPRKEAEQIIVNAWYEAFGTEPPAPAAPAKKGAKTAQKSELHDQWLGTLRGAGGIKKWNNAKDQIKVLGVHLKKADLSGCQLQALHLGEVDCTQATFAGADLEKANAYRAKLSRSNFTNANCREMNFNGASLIETDLTGSDLSNAWFHQANLKGAICRGANFTGAHLVGADLRGADLTDAILIDAAIDYAKYDENTRLPSGFTPPEKMKWLGKGQPPSFQALARTKPVGRLDIDAFMKRLEAGVDAAKLDKALAMLKADRFKLYAQVTDDHLVGIVKSQGDPNLVYSCKLASDGTYGCCTQNLNICGGLRGSLCKHLLVLIVGMAKAGELDTNAIDTWVLSSRGQKPVLDKDAMSETFLRYKGAEAGEVDWRPTETIPEDYYAM